ncbi:hypothetical protein GCM10022240_06670 [Microbacterium kribbense]|uniref:Uncharacterized protein n=1 Tax=Microbacterium kribbense TaxID=433645 RepID=A0ABP7G6L1_9MICO
MLLHQGFMIETGRVWEPLRSALAAHSRQSVTLQEHYLRTIDSAHALGHDPDVALAATLSLAIDQLGADSVDVMAEGAGTQPALIAALNDPRVRSLVIWAPTLRHLDSARRLVATSTAAYDLTEAEVSIGVHCTHQNVDALPPAAGLQLRPGALDIPLLVVDVAGSPGAALIAREVPDCSLLVASDSTTMLGERELIEQAIGFLSTRTVPRSGTRTA